MESEEDKRKGAEEWNIAGKSLKLNIFFTEARKSNRDIQHACQELIAILTSIFSRNGDIKSEEHQKSLEIVRNLLSEAEMCDGQIIFEIPIEIINKWPESFPKKCIIKLESGKPTTWYGKLMNKLRFSR